MNYHDNCQCETCATTRAGRQEQERRELTRRIMQVGKPTVSTINEDIAELLSKMPRRTLPSFKALKDGGPLIGSKSGAGVTKRETVAGLGM